MKTALTIAGSDCSGGSGIQGDLKTFAAHQIFGMSVITAVVAENTYEVTSLEAVSPNMITDQMTAVFEDIPPDAVKIGMLPNVETIHAVADQLEKYRPAHIVVDPVMVATSGTEGFLAGSAGPYFTPGGGVYSKSAGSRNHHRIENRKYRTYEKSCPADTGNGGKICIGQRRAPLLRF